MPRVRINSFIILSRRAYSVATENARAQAAASVTRKAAVDSSGLGSQSEVQAAAEHEKEEIFWMRDPTTGNWIPESHFGEIDVAELREKLLSKKTA